MIKNLDKKTYLRYVRILSSIDESEIDIAKLILKNYPGLYCKLGDDLKKNVELAITALSSQRKEYSYRYSSFYYKSVDPSLLLNENYMSFVAVKLYSFKNNFRAFVKTLDSDMLMSRSFQIKYVKQYIDSIINPINRDQRNIFLGGDKHIKSVIKIFDLKEDDVLYELLMIANNYIDKYNEYIHERTEKFENMNAHVIDNKELELEKFKNEYELVRTRVNI